MEVQDKYLIRLATQWWAQASGSQNTVRSMGDDCGDLGKALASTAGAPLATRYSPKPEVRFMRT
jgi:hypothetical protein